MSDEHEVSRAGPFTASPPPPLHGSSPHSQDQRLGVVKIPPQQASRVLLRQRRRGSIAAEYLDSVCAQRRLSIVGKSTLE
jgi:hypothetical protein